jgi:hypothetical protein
MAFSSFVHPFFLCNMHPLGYWAILASSVFLNGLFIPFNPICLLAILVLDYLCIFFFFRCNHYIHKWLSFQDAVHQYQPFSSLFWPFSPFANPP